jgi:hypothetical protein
VHCIHTVYLFVCDCNSLITPTYLDSGYKWSETPSFQLWGVEALTRNSYENAEISYERRGMAHDSDNDEFDVDISVTYGIKTQTNGIHGLSRDKLLRHHIA